MQSSIVLNLVVIADENYVYEENVGGCRIYFSESQFPICSTFHAVHTPYSTKTLGSYREHLMQIA